MDAVKKILAAKGYETAQEMDVEDSVTVEVAEMMDLVIEKIDENRLSVAHYYTQNGDLMSDPEIVFRIDEDHWTPVRYTQHPFIEQHNEDGLNLSGFLKRWNRNLTAQGYVDTASKITMSSAYCGFCGNPAHFRGDGDIDCKCGVTILPDGDNARDAIQTVQDNIQDIDEETNRALKILINYINGGGAFQ